MARKIRNHQVTTGGMVVLYARHYSSEGVAGCNDLPGAAIFPARVRLLKDTDRIGTVPFDRKDS